MDLFLLDVKIRKNMLMTLQYQSYKGIIKYDSVFRACCAAPMWPKTFCYYC